MIQLETILKLIDNIPPELGTFLLSMLPVTEMRVALPLAMTFFGLSNTSALFWSFLGNALIVPIVYGLFPPLFRFTEMHSRGLHRFLETYLRSLERKHARAYTTYSALFLCLFVAIPLPGTGVLTASILAIVFGIRARVAIPMILLGLVLAMTMVFFLTQAGKTLVG